MPHFIFVPEVYVIESSDMREFRDFSLSRHALGLRDNIDEDMSKVQRNFQLLQYSRPEYSVHDKFQHKSRSDFFKRI